MDRTQYRFWQAELPVGDAFGGVAFGEKNDPAVAIGGSAVLGFLGSQSAADAQSDAADRAAAGVDARYRQAREDLAPWRTSGAAANRRLMALLGLTDQPSAPTREQFTTRSGGSFGGPLRLGGPISIARPSVGYSTGMSGRGGTQLQPVFVPQTTSFDQAGYERALADYNAALNAPASDGFGSLLDPFTGADLANEPGYQFGLSEGEKGINRAAIARGSFDSGATLKALQRYGQDYAGTKYGEAYNRDAANKNRIYGYLSGVSGTGANAAGQTAGLGANAANVAGSYLTNAGDARASGIVGGINALTSGVGSYLDYQQNQQVLDYLRGLRQPTIGVPGAWQG